MTSLIKAAGSTLSNMLFSVPAHRGGTTTTSSSSTADGQQNPPSPPFILDPIPDFNSMGVADNPAAIREELRRGPSVSFQVGPEGTLFHVPARLLQYHSPWFRESLAATTTQLEMQMPIVMEEHGSAAFGRLVSWLQEGGLRDEFVGFCAPPVTTAEAIDATTGAITTTGGNTFSYDPNEDTSDDDSNDNDSDMSIEEGEIVDPTASASSTSTSTIHQAAQSATSLLCAIHYLADDLQISALQTATCHQLTQIADRCAEMGHPTPLTPTTILGIFSGSGSESESEPDNGSDECPLREIAKREVTRALLTHPELYREEEWKECLEVCEGLRESVLGGVLEIVTTAWARGELFEGRADGGGGSSRRRAVVGLLDVDEGRKAGWWRGPF